MKFTIALLLFSSSYQINAVLNQDDAQILASMTLQQRQLYTRLRQQAHEEGHREGKLYVYKVAMIIGFSGLAIINGIEYLYSDTPQEGATAQPLRVQDEIS